MNLQQEEYQKSLEEKSGFYKQKTYQQRYNALKKFSFFQTRKKSKKRQPSKQTQRTYSINQQKRNLSQRKKEMDFYDFMKNINRNQDEQKLHVQNLLFSILLDRLFKIYINFNFETKFQRAVIQQMMKKLIKQYCKAAVIIGINNMHILYDKLKIKLISNKKCVENLCIFYYLFLKQIYLVKDILSNEHLFLMYYIEKDSSKKQQNFQKMFKAKKSQIQQKQTNKKFQFVLNRNNKTQKKNKDKLIEDLVKVSTQKENLRIELEDQQLENKQLEERLVIFEKSQRTYVEKIKDLRQQVQQEQKKQQNYERQLKTIKMDNEFYQNILNKNTKIDIKKYNKENKYDIRYLEKLKIHEKSFVYQYTFQKTLIKYDIVTNYNKQQQKIKNFQQSFQTSVSNQDQKSCVLKKNPFWIPERESTTSSIEEQFFKAKSLSLKNLNVTLNQFKRRKSRSMANLININKTQQNIHQKVQNVEKLCSGFQNRKRSTASIKSHINKRDVLKEISQQNSIRKFSVQQQKQIRASQYLASSKNIKGKSLLLKIPIELEQEKQIQEKQEKDEINKKEMKSFNGTQNVLSFNGTQNLLQSFGSTVSQQKKDLANINKNIQQVQRVMKKFNIRNVTYNDSQEDIYLQIFYCLRVIMSEDFNLKCKRKTNQIQRKNIYIRGKFKQLEKILQEENRKFQQKRKKKSSQKRKAVILKAQDIDQSNQKSQQILESYLKNYSKVLNLELYYKLSNLKR